MAQNIGGNAKDRRALRRAIQRSKVSQKMPAQSVPQDPIAPVGMETNPTATERIFAFLENSIVLAVMGVIGGLVGVFVAGRYLTLLSVPILLGLHRSRALVGLGKVKKASAYFSVLILSALLLWLLGVRIDRSRSHIPTVQEIAQGVKGVLGSSSPMPAKEQQEHGDSPKTEPKHQAPDMNTNTKGAGQDAINAKLKMLDEKLDDLRATIDQNEQPMRPGFSYHFLLKIYPTTEPTIGDAYLFDQGELSGGRVSAYLTRDNRSFVFEITEKGGAKYSVSAPIGADGFQLQKPVYLALSCGLAYKKTYLSISADNKPVGQLIVNHDLDLSFMNKHETILGTNLEKEHHGIHMDLYAWIGYSMTLAPADIGQVFDSFKKSMVEHNIH